MKRNKKENKKILVIVPHQDDEINIAGGTIYSLGKKNNIKVVFTTNGDYIYNAKIRYKEAIKSLKILGVKKENIYFLGYSDQPYDQKNHMYNTDKNWISKKGINKIYGALGIDEYCFIKNKKHNLFNKKNLQSDMKMLIEEFVPEIIICVDLDYHPDHIMTSLCFEKALGEILLDKPEYEPIVLKTFAYENSYLGKNDFNSINSKGMIFKVNNSNELINNPYYNMNEKIEVKIDPICYSKKLLLNPIWKAINKHKSQLLVKHAFSIMNNNNIFWRRRTDNLLKIANIDVSSGDKKYINDFVICDSDNILNGNKRKICYNKKIWIPSKSDNNKTIKITFVKSYEIEKLVLYSGRINENYINNIEVYINDNEPQQYFIGNKIKNEIYINKIVNKIVIKIIDKNIENGFSEIEVLPKDKKKKKIEDLESIYIIKNDKKFVNFLIFINKFILMYKIFITRIYRKVFIKK